MELANKGDMCKKIKEYERKRKYVPEVDIWDALF